MGKFINFSNHNSQNWSEQQVNEARKWGDIIDIPFPAVCADATKKEIMEIGDKYVDIICANDPGAVMCQGEFTLSFYVVSKLVAKGISCVSACTERVAEVKELPNGQIEKKSIFKFVCFREYALFERN